MDYLADFKPTQTISIDPPGGTHPPHGPQHSHLPLPTNTFPTARPEFIHAHQAGHTALWVVFTFFTIGLVGVLLLTLRAPRRSRLFHGLSALVLTIAMVSYLAMATGLGVSFVPIHNHGAKGSLVHLFRQLYWARYIDWLFTTPLLLLSLAALAGLSPATTLYVVLVDVFMIVTGLFGGLVNARWASGERARWAFFAISTFAFLLIWFSFFTAGAKAATYRAKSTRGLYLLLAAMTFILWAGYPIVFGLSEGANKISVDAEIIAYGVLDVAAKLGFTYLLLFLHTHDDTGPWTLPEWWTENPQGHGPDGRGVYGAIRPEN